MNRGSSVSSPWTIFFQTSIIATGRACEPNLPDRMASTRLQKGLRATFVGLTVNALLAIIKLAAGLVGHSNALVADAVESIADILSSLVVWRALVVASAPADADHPYGHGKAEPLAAATVATLLLLAAVGITVQAI